MTEGQKFQEEDAAKEAYNKQHTIENKVYLFFRLISYHRITYWDFTKICIRMTCLQVDTDQI